MLVQNGTQIGKTLLVEAGGGAVRQHGGGCSGPVAHRTDQRLSVTAWPVCANCDMVVWSVHWTALSYICPQSKHDCVQGSDGKSISLCLTVLSFGGTLALTGTLPACMCLATSLRPSWTGSYPSPTWTSTRMARLPCEWEKRANGKADMMPRSRGKSRGGQGEEGKLYSEADPCIPLET